MAPSLADQTKTTRSRDTARDIDTGGIKNVDEKEMAAERLSTFNQLFRAMPMMVGSPFHGNGVERKLHEVGNSF